MNTTFDSLCSQYCTTILVCGRKENFYRLTKRRNQQIDFFLTTISSLLKQNRLPDIQITGDG